MVRYSLKKAMMTESKDSKTEILSEGWFTDLAVAIAAGGSQGIKDMIADKLQGLSQMAGDLENSQALDMVQRFRKMGLKNLGGENLEKIEKALLKQRAKAEKERSDKPRKIDTEKLTKYLLGDMQEAVSSYKGASLKSVFLVD